MNWNSRSLHRCLTIAFSIVVFCLIANRAWLEEDSFFTFRVVDNFVHGFGLRWNIDERVQVYTHPLWMLMHIPFYAVFGNPFIASACVSAACLIATLWLLCQINTGSIGHKATFIFLPLIFSNTYKDFTFSGLENPLSGVLLVWLLSQWLTKKNKDNPYLFYTIIALAMVTRYDNLVIILPAALLHSWQILRNLKPIKLIIYSAPLWMWMGFALLYYGFVLPNTKYGKLHAMVPPELSSRWAFNYFNNLPYYDPFTAFYLILSVAVALYYALRKNSEITCILLGFILHAAYIFYIGGDYMAGRFFYTPFMVGVTLLCFLSPLLNYRKLILVATLLISINTIDRNSLLPFLQKRWVGYPDRLIDARNLLIASNGLWNDQNHFFSR